MKWGILGGAIGVTLALLVAFSDNVVLWIYGFIIVVLVAFRLILAAAKGE